MSTLDVSDYTVDVPAPEEYVRGASFSAVTVRMGWLKLPILVTRAWIAARIAAQLLRTVRNSRRLEKALARDADDTARRAHDELVRLLDLQRELYRKAADLRSCVLSVEGGNATLVPTIVRLLDEFLVVVDDTVETLELCVDQEVRKHIASELQQIAADSG